MDGELIIKEAKRLTNEKQFDEALNLLKSLFDTIYAEIAYFQAGKTMMHAGFEKKAKKYFNKYISLGEDNKADVDLWKGKFRLFVTEDDKKAENYFTCAIGEEKVDKKFILLDSALTYYNKGKNVNAEKNVNKVLEMDPKNSAALFLLAKIYNRRKNYKQAIECLYKVVDNYDYNRESAYKLLIDICKKENKISEAQLYEGIYNDFMNNTDEDIEMLNDGNNDLSLGLYSSANDSYQSLLDNNKCISAASNGVYKTSLVLAGDNYLKDSNYDDALRCYKELFRKNKCMSHAILGLKLTRALKKADIHLLNGNLDLAFKYYNKIVDDKIYKDINEYKLEMLAHMIFYNRMNVIKNHPYIHNKDNEVSSTMIGNAYYEAEKYDMAKQYYIKSIDNNENVFDALFGLVKIKVQNNEIEGIDNFLSYYYEFYKDRISSDDINTIQEYINNSTGSFTK